MNKRILVPVTLALVVGIGFWFLRKSHAPDLSVGPDGLSKATVVIETDRGKIKFKFFPREAPLTVGRLVELIGSGFYNGLKFNRVIPGLVVQAGDPHGDEKTGTGKKIKAEFSSLHHSEGTLSMARESAIDSADCIFQITLGDNKYLDGKYTVFGRVTEGMAVLHTITQGDVMRRVIFE